MRIDLLAAAAALAAVTLLPATASAQYANRDEVVTRTDVRSIVNRLGHRTDEFKDSFDKAVEHSLLDGSRLEDRARHRADDLHDAAKKLADVYGDKHDKHSPAVRDQLDKTLSAAADVNRIMVNHRFTERLQRNWDMLRSDLNALASAYQLPPVQ
jgi:hypothetical protein